VAIGIGKILALSAILISGVLGIFLSQAAALNYQDLFEACVLLCIFHWVLAAIYFIRIRNWTRWMTLILSVIVLVFAIELVLRVVYGIRLI
jgi:hypothetical protein